MKKNSHCWLRTTLQRLQCICIILWKYSNEQRTGAVALIRVRRVLFLPLHVGRLIGAALIQVNMVYLITISLVSNITSLNNSCFKGVNAKYYNI